MLRTKITCDNCGIVNRRSLIPTCFRCGYPIRSLGGNAILTSEQAKFREKKADQLRAAKAEARALG